MVKVIAHRGFGKVYKQNTLPAFEYAETSTAFGIEVDVHMTADEHFIIFHDKKANRLGGKIVKIETATLEKLNRVRVFDKNKRHKIPLMSEFLDIAKRGEKTAVIELKCELDDEHLDKVIELIKEHHSLKQTIFLSFSIELLCRIRERLPSVDVQLARFKLTDEVFDVLKTRKFDLAIHHQAITPDMMEKCHEHGIKINAWTVNGWYRYNFLDCCGVDFITTDKDFENTKRRKK